MLHSVGPDDLCQASHPKLAACSRPLQSEVSLAASRLPVMSVTLHRSPRVDLLADALAARLAEPSGDPFAPELVVVPAKGVERWLSQRLSHVLGAERGDGVAANIAFCSPGALVSRLVHGDADDPWHPDLLVWPLLEVIDASLGQPWCAALTRHLGGAGARGDERRHGRRWSVAHRLARLFASYASQRPTMMARWESGADTDGTGRPVDADLAWQAELWRRLVAHVGGPSPVARHGTVVAALETGTAQVDLPARLSLFGHTRLSVTEVEIVEALGRHRQVDVWLPHPSDHLWQALRPDVGAVARVDDDSHVAARHPLLATLGRDVRELQRTVGPISATSVAIDPAVPRPATLLGRLQAGIEANRAPGGDVRIDPTDTSVQVHACHGPARQVEVLREVVLGLLADDPSLEPRDIVVMCPDIEQFAPLIEAAFGLGGTAAESDAWHPGHALQVRLADRSLVQTNPVLGVVERLLALADGRAEASAVLDLAGTEPVRRRFGFSDDDLDQITRWVDEAGIRWAFDAAHRAPFGLGGFVQNTWRFGLDRVLAGVAVSDDAQRYFDTTLPYDAIGSSDIDLAGRLAELLDRVTDLADRLSGTRPVGEWVATLAESISALTAVPWGEEWQIHQAERELAAIGADQAESGLQLRLSDVRALMADRLAGRPTRANFRTGSLTVCTMVPMRSVPHRVVCLLGLDDGVFPRAGSVDGDNVLSRRPLTGERDLRSEDRQLLLDAVLAATEHLVVTYSGADEVNGQVRPPSVPLGELLDALEATAPGARTAVVRRHPLQAFDPRNFTTDRSTGRPFSFDASARAAAVAGRSERIAPPSLSDLELPPAAPDDVDLAELGAFLRAPVKEFLRRRVGINVYENDAVVADSIPVELDGLQRWAVGSAMLDDLLAGTSLDEALQLAWRRGTLPPGQLGWQIAKGLADSAASVGAKTLQIMDGHPRESVDVDLDLGGGRRLRGTVSGVHGDRVVSASFSSLGPRHHLDAWLPLLALCAAHPGRPWSSGTIARHAGAAGMVVFAAVPADVALERLKDLVALRDLGMTRPLRLPLKTGFAQARSGEHGRFGARSAWVGDRFEGERNSDLHPLVWGADAPFSVLTRAPAGLDLATLAERVWRPVLEAVIRA